MKFPIIYAISQKWLSQPPPPSYPSSPMFYTHLQTSHHHQKKKKKKQQQQQPMWKYILKEKLHAWFENEREQESAFRELKIS